MLSSYYRLTKPGIIYGNALAAIAGALFAMQRSIDLGLLVGMVCGVSLVIGSACVVNNYIDRDIDKQMKRTKNRALVTGEISGREALLFAASLAALGFAALITFTNWATVIIGLIGYFDYVVAYAITKRTTEHGTLVGSISGATPPLAGYIAVTGHFDIAAWLLFASMLFWQMPHFYAIALYRKDDYAQAGLPVLSVTRSFKSTVLASTLYIIGYIAAGVGLYIWGYASIWFLIPFLIISCVWLYKALQGLKSHQAEQWGRALFSFSLIVLLVWCALLAITPWLS